MSTTCPSCGKPVRPGAKYCGNCGATILSSSGEASQAPSERGPVCPHCNKPIRPEAKFCPSCGKSLAPAAPLPAAPPSPSAAAPQLPPEKQPVPEKPKVRKNIIWLIPLLAVCCLGAATAGYIYIRDPFHWLKPKETPFPPIVIPTSTETPAVPPTLEPPLPLSTETATPTLPDTPTPVLTPTLLITATEAAPLLTQAPVLTSTNTPLLEENFNGNLGENWYTWGTPLPQIGGMQELALELAGNAPAASGVTSLQKFSLVPGVRIQFSARIEGTAPQFAVVFDWDPSPLARTGNDGPRLISLAIQGDGVFLQVRTDKCLVSGVDTNAHTYRIDVLQGLSFAAFVDDRFGCQLTVPPLQNNQGVISFSGRGWIDQVIVIGP